MKLIKLTIKQCRPKAAAKRSIKHIIKMYDSFKKQCNKMMQLGSRRLWQYIGILSFVIITFLVFAFLPIFSGTILKSVPVAYTTQTVNDATMELGNYATKQTGADGIKKITYSEHKSLFNLIFGGGESSKLTVKSSTITIQPVQEIVSSGTLKYQYMYCSNGSYRYYTDEQFKDPKAGFTHKSPDYCAQNNQGTETGLGNTPAANTTTTSSTTTTTSSACTYKKLPAPPAIYKDTNLLLQGQTQQDGTGVGGYEYICNGRPTNVVQGVAPIVWVGTGTSSNTPTTGQSQGNTPSSNGISYSQASAACQSYVQNLAAGGTTSGLSSLFASCMHQYGY